MLRGASGCLWGGDLPRLGVALVDAGGLLLLAGHGGTSAIALDVDLQDDGVVDKAIDRGERHGGIAEAVEMPRRLTGESLKSGWLTRIIPSMATPILSATDALDGDRR
jgi:hypothetical protein